MENRKIVVVETRTQKKSVIMSSATTLGELKRDFTEAGINYKDMAFYEGVSKTELKSDDSMLPHDILYKGHTTNELVFMLTNINKKIKSGMYTRKEVYRIIKENQLQEDVKEAFGRNYTQISTEELSNFIMPLAPSTIKENTLDRYIPQNENSHSKLVEIAILLTSSLGGVLNEMKEFKELSTLTKNNVLKNLSEIDNILHTENITKENIKSSYSDSELDEMMNDALGL